MAGIFKFPNFYKPGKGVDPDAPPKKPLFRYFELYWRKFTRMILLNLLFFVIVLPIITVIFLQYDMMVQSLTPDPQAGEALGELLVPAIALTIAGSLPAPVNWVLLLASIVLYGPAMCGLSYVLRNFYREEHVWPTDFFVKMKENFLQGMILGIFELGTIYLFFFNLTLTSVDAQTGESSVLVFVIKAVSIIGIVFIFMLRNYTYTMAVTFKLSSIVIIKNALLFSIIGMIRNLGIILLEVALLIPILIISAYDIVMLGLFYMTGIGFAAMFACYPLIYKYMIEPSQGKGDGQDNQDNEFTDKVERVDPRLLGE